MVKEAVQQTLIAGPCHLALAKVAIVCNTLLPFGTVSQWGPLPARHTTYCEEDGLQDPPKQGKAGSHTCTEGSCDHVLRPSCERHCLLQLDQHGNLPSTVAASFVGKSSR